jgi:multiple sugar transport system ATP-binding protein
LQPGKVQLGVRPDDLMIGGACTLMEGKITLREPLGSETLIYVETEQGELIAKADGRYPPAVGERIQLGVDPENLYLFDAENGKALS